MSDSSEDEDLSRFKDVVDTSFTNLINGVDTKPQENQKTKSERYLDESSHYNDVKVPLKMQNQIGSKISMIIERNIAFVEVDSTKIKKPKKQGGVKLFNSSEGFLSCEEAKDVYTEQHNTNSKRLKLKRKQTEDQSLNENEKLLSATVSGEDILLKDDTKMWKSRRKEKIFKYKTQGKNKVLVAVD